MTRFKQTLQLSYTALNKFTVNINTKTQATNTPWNHICTGGHKKHCHKKEKKTINKHNLQEKGLTKSIVTKKGKKCKKHKQNKTNQKKIFTKDK